MPSEKSCNKIEGDWKDFRFRRIQPADHAAVFEHLANNFIKDEPTVKLLGWSQDYVDDMNRVVEILVTHGLSFLVEHKESGKIAGVRITFIHSPEISFDSIPLHSRQVQIILKFIHELEARADVANKYNISTWAEFFIASTSRDFRNLGIAGELYDRSIKFLQAEGFEHALIVVTSPYTKQAIKKRGFEQVARMDYDEITDHEESPVFNKEDLNEDHFALVMVKRL